jgi:hypothetical protein
MELVQSFSPDCAEYDVLSGKCLHLEFPDCNFSVGLGLISSFSLIFSLLDASMMMLKEASYLSSLVLTGLKGHIERKMKILIQNILFLPGCSRLWWWTTWFFLEDDKDDDGQLRPQATGQPGQCPAEFPGKLSYPGEWRDSLWVCLVAQMARYLFWPASYSSCRHGQLALPIQTRLGWEVSSGKTPGASLR